ncbi:hypothetical protein Ciccas_011725 [Cichlidogyrus casuarinus]|uniref:Fibronectin type-III domain-containing protein n=1 Tax=Cichlidogyrus casuarinus TaxID=1844966 RepID=A0ABD2PVA7_9PLAT
MGLRASNCKPIQYSQGTRTTFGVAYVDVDNVDNGGNPLSDDLCTQRLQSGIVGVANTQTQPVYFGANTVITNQLFFDYNDLVVLNVPNFGQNAAWINKPTDCSYSYQVAQRVSSDESTISYRNTGCNNKFTFYFLKPQTSYEYKVLAYLNGNSKPDAETLWSLPVMTPSDLLPMNYGVRIDGRLQQGRQRDNLAWSGDYGNPFTLRYRNMSATMCSYLVSISNSAQLKPIDCQFLGFRQYPDNTLGASAVLFVESLNRLGRIIDSVDEAAVNLCISNVIVTKNPINPYPFFFKNDAQCNRYFMDELQFPATTQYTQTVSWPYMSDDCRYRYLVEYVKVSDRQDTRLANADCQTRQLPSSNIPPTHTVSMVYVWNL